MQRQSDNGVHPTVGQHARCRPDENHDSTSLPAIDNRTVQLQSDNGARYRH